MMKSLWPAIIWGVFIFFVSSFPGDDIPNSFANNIPFADKIIHFFLYFILIILVLFGFFKNSKNTKTTQKFLVSFIICLLYGVLLEILQNTVFIMRSADLLDVAANISGSFFGFILFYCVKKFKAKNK